MAKADYACCVECNQKMFYQGDSEGHIERNAAMCPDCVAALREYVAEDAYAPYPRPFMVGLCAARDLIAYVEGLEARVKKLESAVLWACGLGDDFPPRHEGQGQYWWRAELHKRSGVIYPGERPAPPPEGGKR